MRIYLIEMKWVGAIALFLTISSSAQPLVHEEAHHIPVVQNKFLRVLNVVAEAGDTTAYHIHQNDIAYIAIKGATIWLNELNKDSRTVELPSGWIGSDLTHSVNPIIHRFANVGSSNFQLVAIEVLTDKHEDTDFIQLGKVLYEDERFSFQEISEGIVLAKVPCVLLILAEMGQIEALDYLKPGKKLPISLDDESTKSIIIQVK